MFYILLPFVCKRLNFGLSPGPNIKKILTELRNIKICKKVDLFCVSIYVQKIVQ